MNEKFQIKTIILQEGKNRDQFVYNHKEKWIYNNGSERIIFHLRSWNCSVGEPWNHHFFDEKDAPDYVKKLFS